MKLEALDVAKTEAERFLKAAYAVPIGIVKLDRGRIRRELKDCTKETAALRRASMDLTRALSELRKP